MDLYCVVNDNQLLGIYTCIVDALQVCRRQNISANNIFIGYRNCDAEGIKKYRSPSPPPPNHNDPQIDDSA